MGTLWYGGPIYTLQEEGEQVEAVFTRGDIIIEAGSFEKLKDKYKHKISNSVNLQGSIMLPGFIDSHLHLIGHGEKLLRLDLSNFKSKKEVLAAVKNYSKIIQKGEWIIGEGWNENLWETPDFLTLKELDEIVADHPLLLKRVCRHTIVVNSEALKAANIDQNTVCPPGGIIGKDNNGELNGLFQDEALQLITTALEKPSSTYLETALRTAIHDAYRLGLTGAHSEDLSYYGSFHKTYEAFQKVIVEEGKKFRVQLLVHHGVKDDLVAHAGKFKNGNEWVEFGAIKIFADGSLGGRTALLSHPYADDPSTNGVAIFTQEQLNKLVKEARAIEMPVAIHAIGDLAFDMALTAIEAYPLKGMGRDRLIHAPILRRDLIERVKKLPLILDIQPGFVAADFPWVIERVGEKNMDYNFAWKTLLNEGIPCAGGSDAPIEPLEPLVGIQAAVTRTKLDDPNKTVYIPKEKLTVYEAVCLYTKGSAFAAGDEKKKGVIKEGYFADFTILEDDIFQMPVDTIANIPVAGTVISGEIVYDRQNKFC